MKKINRYHILITKTNVLIINSYGHIFKPYINKYGWWRVRLNEKTYLIHYLVAYHYLNAEEIDKVIHINGCRNDNRPCNLKVIKGYYNNRLDKYLK